MTVRQLLQKQKYHTKVIVDYFSTLAGEKVQEDFYLMEYNEIIYRHGNTPVKWFYITHSPQPTLVIEI